MSAVNIPSVRASDLVGDNGQVDAARVAAAIDLVSKAVREAFARGLSLRENLRSQVFSFTVRTGATVSDSFPINLKLEPHMPDSPLWVELVDTKNVESPTTGFTSAIKAFWQPISGRQISLTYISGLDANSLYACKAIAIGT